jgi:LL-diaminopimelate aminotransferase
LEEAGIVVTPGNGFGKEGEGYFRMTITVDKVRLEDAIQRLSKLK